MAKPVERLAWQSRSRSIGRPTPTLQSTPSTAHRTSPLTFIHPIMIERHPTINRRRAIGFAIPSALALLSVVARPAWAQSTGRLPLGTAINRAGIMRGLSQRLSKAYVQATLNVLPEQARRIMLTSHHLISHGMGELVAGAPPSDVRPLLLVLQQDIDALFGLTTQPARSAGIAAVIRAADSMLESADQVTRSYEKTAAQAAARVVNVAGRQRMLSQRAARAYFLIASGQTQPAIHEQLQRARKEFDEGLIFLQSAPIATAPIRHQLELAKAQWLFLHSVLQRQVSSEGLQTVATTSERVFDVMNDLTDLYDAAVRELFA